MGQGAQCHSWALNQECAAFVILAWTLVTFQRVGQRTREGPVLQAGMGRVCGATNKEGEALACVTPTGSSS